MATFGKSAIVEQFDSLALEDFQQDLECRFVDESYSYHPCDLILRHAEPIAGRGVRRDHRKFHMPPASHVRGVALLPSKKPIFVGCSRWSPLRGCRSIALASFTNKAKERWATDFNLTV